MKKIDRKGSEFNTDRGHVLFFNPPSDILLYRGAVCTWVSKAKYLWQPFDFILLSALVPPSVHVSYLDDFIHKVKIGDVLQLIREDGVTHVVMSMSSIEWLKDLDTLRQLRNKFPNLNITVLGDVFQERFFVEQVLPERVSIVRYPLDPEITKYFESGHIVTSSLLQKLEGDGNHLPPVRIQGCVDFPVPRHGVFLNKKHRSPFDKYRRSAIVNVSWGCPYACSYCSWSSPYLPFVYKSVPSLICELEFLHRLKIKEIFFADLSFGHPSHIIFDILNTMIQRQWRFSWHCYIKAGSVSPQFLSTMRKAGCHTIIVGVESSNPDLSRFNRNVTLRDINDTITLCHKLGMDICGDFIIGLNESVENWREMVKFAIDLHLDFASFNVYTPLLGSLERYRKIEEGILKEGDWGFETTARNKSLIEHSENRRKCVKMFYSRPTYWLKRLVKIKTIDEFFMKLEEGMYLFMEEPRRNKKPGV